MLAENLSRDVSKASAISFGGNWNQAASHRLEQSAALKAVTTKGLGLSL